MVENTGGMRFGLAFHVGNRGSNPLGDATDTDRLYTLNLAAWRADRSLGGFFIPKNPIGTGWSA